MLLLLATLLFPAQPAADANFERPWTLVAGIERDGMTVWLSAPQGSQEECAEAMAGVAFSQPVRGRLVTVYCEPALRMT